MLYSYVSLDRPEIRAVGDSVGAQIAGTKFFETKDFFLESIACLIPSVRCFHYPTPYLTNYCFDIRIFHTLIVGRYYILLLHSVGQSSPPRIYLSRGTVISALHPRYRSEGHCELPVSVRRQRFLSWCLLLLVLFLLQMGDNSTTVATGEVASAMIKSDAGQEATPSSLESSPEREAEIVQDPAQPQKRKGGRKPVRLSHTVLRLPRLVAL